MNTTDLDKPTPIQIRHALKQPLTVIKGSLYALEKNPHKAERLKLIAKIDAQVDHLDHLINEHLK
jgi:signal transduction histidine kinase